MIDGMSPADGASTHSGHACPSPGPFSNVGGMQPSFVRTVSRQGGVFTRDQALDHASGS